jgi:hypothetical protein
MTVADTCTSIANCFYNESTTIATDITDVQNFFNNCLPSSNVIASVSGLFRNRGISYTLDEINSDLA